MKTREQYQKFAERIIKEVTNLLREAPLQKKTDVKPQAPTLPKPVSDTGVKEGLVMYFATQNVKDIDAAIAKILEKKDTQLKFDTKTITDNKDKYDGNPISGDKTAQAIQYLNTQVITDPMLKKMFLNGLSSGKYLSKTISGGKGINPQNVDRGNETFSGIKSHAIKLVQGVGVRISEGESDKWCPADIFVYGTGVSISKVESTTTLNVDKNSLNSLFVESFAMPPSGKILGVSLKEEKAQAGKATSFLSVLERDKNYPEIKVDKTQSNFTSLAYLFKAIRSQKDIGYVSEAISILQKNEEPIKKVVKNQVDILKTALMNQLKTSLASTSDKKKIKLKDNQLAILQNKKGVFDKTLTRNYVKQAKLEKEFTMTSELQTAITSFNSAILAYAKKRYNKSKDDFKKILESSNFNQPTEKKKLDSTNAELLLKKAGCYEIASKVLDGVKDGKKLNIPPAFKNIILEKQNVFLAVAAYAISQGGISPTFFKLIGSESGGEAHVKTFYGDGILSLEKGTDVEIIDSGGFAGFEAQFKTQILKGKQLIDKYQVTLGFQYAGDQFKIEVTELK
jgi:tetratricopeptide (TPR) repeat protein